MGHWIYNPILISLMAALCLLRVELVLLCWRLRLRLHCPSCESSGSSSIILPRNEFPGPLGPRAQKVENGVERKSQSTVFQLFCLFEPRGPEGSGTHFLTLFPTLGPKGPNDPCSGQKFLQTEFIFKDAPSGTLSAHVQEG